MFAESESHACQKGFYLDAIKWKLWQAAPMVGQLDGLNLKSLTW
jgi:hypothetical protein